MTANQLVRVLNAAGPLPAVELARRFGVKVEDLYARLVTAEASGLVRVNVTGNGTNRTWEAMQEAA